MSRFRFMTVDATRSIQPWSCCLRNNGGHCGRAPEPEVEPATDHTSVGPLRFGGVKHKCVIAICAGDFPGIAVTSERLLIVRGRSEHWPSVP